MQQNAKRTQIERKKNVLRTDPQIRELSGNDFNPAKEPRTETIVENKNSSVCRKKELILNISKNFNRIEGPGINIYIYIYIIYNKSYIYIVHCSSCVNVSCEFLRCTSEKPQGDPA